MIAKRSLHWILSPIIVAIILFILLATPFAFIFVGISLFFIVFFRDPEREIGEGIVSPADGKLSSIEEENEITKISIVMGLSNVHVNRVPLNGKIVSIKHIDGKHIPAFNKDSEANERLITTLDTDIGEVKIVQIAGAFARRIEPYIKEGATLIKGQRIGMIRFGSRVDLYLPKKRIKLVAKVGSNVKAAASYLALVVDDEN